MTTILPPKTNLGTDIGRALGQGFQNTFEPALQQQYNRGMISKALEEAKMAAREPGADAFDKTIALTKAFAGIPGAERYAGTLIPQAISYSERAKANQPGQPGAMGNQANIPGQPGQRESAGQQGIPSVMNLIPPNPPGQIADPNSPPSFSAPYNDQQIQQIRQESRRLGYTPETEERLVQDANEMNENARAGYKDVLASYSAAQTARKDILENQQLFRNYVRENAKEFTSPDEMELALKASEKYQNESSFANRLAKVKQDLRPYQASKKVLERTLKRPIFGYNKDQLKLAQNGARVMIDNGQKDQLRLMIAEGGQGDVEEAKLINDLPENTQKVLNGFGKFIDPATSISSKNPESPEFQKQLDSANTRLNNQKNLVEETLSKQIVPGTYKDPGTNLLLVRKSLMEKGLNWSDAGLMIQNAIARANVKLDPHQQIDYQKMGYPPLTAEDYAQNVLNYVLFGKE